VSATPYDRPVYLRLRPLILERDGGRCQIRGPGCTGAADSVDHIVPLALGGTHAPENLRSACLHCNSAAGRRIALARRAGSAVGRRSRRW
jgi:5-methylcytosine-specific restriction endonuclease McrA